MMKKILTFILIMTFLACFMPSINAEEISTIEDIEPSINSVDPPDPDEPNDYHDGDIDEQYGYMALNFIYNHFDSDGNKLGGFNSINDTDMKEFLSIMQVNMSSDVLKKTCNILNNDDVENKVIDGMEVYQYLKQGKAGISLANIYAGGDEWTDGKTEEELNKLFHKFNLKYEFSDIVKIYGRYILFDEITREEVAAGKNNINIVINVKQRKNDPIYAQIKAKKILTNDSGNKQELKEGQFEFILRDEEGKEVSRAKNDANGNIVFDPIKFDIFDLENIEEKIEPYEHSYQSKQEKNIKYSIEEVNNSNTCIYYDTHKEDVVVNLKSIKRYLHPQGDGTLEIRDILTLTDYDLTADVEYDKDGAIFINNTKEDFCTDGDSKPDPEGPNIPDPKHNEYRHMTVNFHTNDQVSFKNKNNIFSYKKYIDFVLKEIINISTPYTSDIVMIELDNGEIIQIPYLYYTDIIVDENYKLFGWGNTPIPFDISKKENTIYYTADLYPQVKKKVLETNPNDPDYVKVSFISNKGTIKGTNEYWVLKDTDINLTEPTIENIENYKFLGWSPEIQTKYSKDTIHEAELEYNGPDIVPQTTEEKPDIPDNFVLVEFFKGSEGELSGTTKYWVNPLAKKTIADIQKPEVIPTEG